MALNPFDSDIKLLVFNFFEDTNPQIPIGRRKGVSFAAMKQVDINKTVTDNECCGGML
jgi:hypothetical protein